MYRERKREGEESVSEWPDCHYRHLEFISSLDWLISFGFLKRDFVFVFFMARQRRRPITNGTYQSDLCSDRTDYPLDSHVPYKMTVIQLYRKDRSHTLNSFSNKTIKKVASCWLGGKKRSRPSIERSIGDRRLIDSSRIQLEYFLIRPSSTNWKSGHHQEPKVPVSILAQLCGCVRCVCMYVFFFPFVRE